MEEALEAVGAESDHAIVFRSPLHELRAQPASHVYQRVLDDDCSSRKEQN